MSKVTSSGTNPLVSQFDTSKIFIYGNRFEDAIAVNPDYDTVTIPGGTLMGRVSATQEIVPLVSTANDGSQIPIGILNQDYPVEAGNSAEVSICVSGDVDKSQVVLDAGDDFDTLIDGRSIQDRIGSDTVGIRLLNLEEMTGADND